jgi:predicted Zn-dependent protease
LERALSHSPADETELVWLEVNHGTASNRGQRIDARTLPERTVLVRVIDRGRVGSHRTGTSEPSEIDTAVRMAIAQSRSRDPLPGLPHLPANDTHMADTPDLYDPELAELDADGARALLARLRRRREAVWLNWSDARVAVFNSRGVRRQMAVTGATFETSLGRRPGGGRAASSSRTLQGLQPERIIERARSRHASGPVGDPPTESVSALLSPEATIQLLDILNRAAFSAISYYRGSSFLRQHLDVQVFDRAIHLRDDGTDSKGLPFPFDFEGTAKRPVDLIFKGSPKTPALDQRQAAQLGLPPTGHAIGGNDARAENLFLLPGETSEDQMLLAADGGIWIGSLEHLECYEPTRVQIRAHARGVRRIERGQLGQSLPDLLWEDGLLRAFSSLLALGAEPVVWSARGGFFGAISAPSMAISAVPKLEIL